MLFKFDPYLLGVQLIPPLLRESSFILAIVKALCAHIGKLSEELNESRLKEQEKMGVLPSVLMLESLLNKPFHLEHHQIYVTSRDVLSDVFLYMNMPPGYDVKHPFFYLQDEQHPTYISYKEEPPLDDDITVCVPSFLATSTSSKEDVFGGKNISIISQVMERYKPAGKKYGLAIYQYE